MTYREYEIYLPTKDGDAGKVDPVRIQKIKEELAQAFGGYTQVTQRCEGAWKIGGVTFRDEITIIRVLDDGSSDFDMKAFRRTLEGALKQERVLIVEREVRTV